MRVRAYLDRSGPEVINGWAINEDCPDRPVTLDVLYCGTVIGSCTANRYRHDLLAANMGDGRCGFSVSVHELTQAVSPHRVVLNVRDTEVYLSASEPNAARFDELSDVFESVRLTPFRRRPLCLLHIGFEKTGSTSIQRFLGQSRNELAALGYFVPLSVAGNPDGDIINHIGLASLAVDDRNFLDDFRALFSVTDSESLWQHRVGVARKLAEEIDTCGPSDVVVLSNEHCQSRLSSLREIARLKTLLEYLFQRVHIVAFIRPQHEVALGLYDSSLRNGSFGMAKIPDFSDFGTPGANVVSKEYFDYFQTLSRWSCVFGGESLQVKIYDNSRSGLGVVGQFLEVLGLPDMSRRDITRENRRLSPSSQMALELINESIQRRNLILTSNARSRIHGALAVGQIGPRFLVTRKSVRDFFESFSEANEELRQMWFPDRPSLFDVDFSGYCESEAAIGSRLAQDALVDLLIALAN
jgi:hypothetical protein